MRAKIVRTTLSLITSIAIAMALTAAQAGAQDASINGRVVDAVSKTPIPLAQIQIVGTNAAAGDVQLQLQLVGRRQLSVDVCRDIRRRATYPRTSTLKMDEARRGHQAEEAGTQVVLPCCRCGPTSVYSAASRSCWPR